MRLAKMRKTLLLVVFVLSTQIAVSTSQASGADWTSKADLEEARDVFRLFAQLLGPILRSYKTAIPYSSDPSRALRIYKAIETDKRLLDRMSATSDERPQFFNWIVAIISDVLKNAAQIPQIVRNRRATTAQIFLDVAVLFAKHTRDLMASLFNIHYYPTEGDFEAKDTQKVPWRGSVTRDDVADHFEVLGENPDVVVMKTRNPKRAPAFRSKSPLVRGNPKSTFRGKVWYK